jgi:hypothetical protein
VSSFSVRFTRGRRDESRGEGKMSRPGSIEEARNTKK